MVQFLGEVEDADENDEIRTLFKEAQTHKDEGNQRYKEKRYEDAVESYSKAIEMVAHLNIADKPEGKSAEESETKADDGPDDVWVSASGNDEDHKPGPSSRKSTEKKSGAETAAPSKLDDQSKDELAVFYANRAATFLQLKKYRFVVEDCTEALKLSPKYVKALVRRAQANEAISKLQQALDDYRQVLAIDPSNRSAAEDARRIDEILKAQREKEKAEMMAKLKDLGNTVLGKFGLSLDNFKTQQDPTTGSYNISFQK